MNQDVCRALILGSTILAFSFLHADLSKANEPTDALADKVSMFDLILSACGPNLQIDGGKAVQLEGLWRLELLKNGFAANDQYSKAYIENNKVLIDLTFKAAKISGNRNDWYCQSLFELVTAKLGSDSPLNNLKFENGAMLLK
jgi:hypothetical protein